DECSNSESSDLGITQWLPQRSTFHRERKQREYRCCNGDHDGPNTLDAGVGQSTFQRFALMMHLFNEIKQHDDVAYDHTDKAGESKNRLESKRRTHDV